MAHLALSKQLREQRANLVELNRQCLEKIQSESDQARVKELEQEWDKRDADIVSQTKAIERAEAQERNESEMARPLAERRSGRLQPNEPGEGTDDERKAAYRTAFFDYLRYGERNMRPEQIKILRTGWQRAGADGERRNMTTTVAEGGYTIPEGFYNQLQDNMLAYGGARDGATILTTASGNALPIPTVDATTQRASIVGEGSSHTSPQDPVFGVVTLNAFMYRSIITVSLELLQDSAFDMEAFARAKLTEYIARGTNLHFTLGNGSTQPQGYMVGASSGKTSAAAATVTSNELLDLVHSVDPAYRNQPGTRFKMHDLTLKAIKQLLDTQNRPLWLPGIAVREPDTIHGYRYTINQDMSQLGASQASIAFGDFSKFFIRDVSNILIIRANELHIQNGLIGFYCFSRHDSAVVDAGTDPIKYLVGQSA